MAKKTGFKKETKAARPFEIMETPQGKKPAAHQLNVSEATLFSNTSSTASKRADKENKLNNANFDKSRRSDLLAARQSQNFDYKPLTDCYSYPSDKDDTGDENVQTLFTKIADDASYHRHSQPLGHHHQGSGGS